jgi:RNA recognition motif-containing protein
MMNNIRETSQQDRRVYVGNLSYDVKWHHLKDFMRQGGFRPSSGVVCHCSQG